MKINRRPLGEKGRKILSLVSIICFFAFLTAAVVLVGKPLLTFVSEPERFRLWVESKGFAGRLLFVGMYVVQVIVALIPGEPLEIAAGYAFGAAEGTLLTLIGVISGSILVFLFVRYCGVKAVEVFFPKEKINSLRWLRDAKRRNLLIFLAFLIPGTPKDLLTYFVGLTDIKFTTWLLITSVARLPSIITSTVGGDALGVKNYLLAAVFFGVTLAVSAAGLYFFNRTKSQSRTDGAEK